MTTQPRLAAEPIARILAVGDGRLVGYLYRWNTGEESPMWLGRPRRRVTYEPLGVV